MLLLPFINEQITQIKVFYFCWKVESVGVVEKDAGHVKDESGERVEVVDGGDVVDLGVADGEEVEGFEGGEVL